MEKYFLATIKMYPQIYERYNFGAAVYAHILNFCPTVAISTANFSNLNHSNYSSTSTQFFKLIKTI